MREVTRQTASTSWPPAQRSSACGSLQGNLKRRVQLAAAVCRHPAARPAREPPQTLPAPRTQSRTDADPARGAGLRRRPAAHRRRRPRPGLFHDRQPRGRAAYAVQCPFSSRAHGTSARTRSSGDKPRTFAAVCSTRFVAAAKRLAEKVLFRCAAIRNTSGADASTVKWQQWAHPAAQACWTTCRL